MIPKELGYKTKCKNMKYLKQKGHFITIIIEQYELLGITRFGGGVECSSDFRTQEDINKLQKAFNEFENDVRKLNKETDKQLQLKMQGTSEDNSWKIKLEKVEEK